MKFGIAVRRSTFRLLRILIDLCEDGLRLIRQLFERRGHSAVVVALKLGLGGFNLFFEFCSVFRVNFIAEVFQRLFNGENHAVQLIVVFHDFLPLFVFLFILLRFFDRFVDIRFGKIGGRGDRDILRFARSQIFCGYVHDAVGIDIERNFDLRHASRCGSNPHELKAAERLIILGKLSFTLENVNIYLSLIIGSRGEYLRFFDRNGRVALDQFGRHAAQCLDAERGA